MTKYYGLEHSILSAKEAYLETQQANYNLENHATISAINFVRTSILAAIGDGKFECYVDTSTFPINITVSKFVANLQNNGYFISPTKKPEIFFISWKHLKRNLKK